MRSFRLSSLLLATSVAVLAVPVVAENVPTTMIVGMDESGHAIHPLKGAPADSWSATRPWNGKAARFNEATHRLAFETFDADLLAGIKPHGTADHGNTSRKSAIPITAGVFNAATASGDPTQRGKTAVLYITEPNGSDGICLGGNTLTDGKDGVAILGSPSANGTAQFRQESGAKIYDVQNKDTVAWYPTGDWLITAIELPQHAGSHNIAKSGLGCFVDIWAVYVRPGDPKFGKIWVQLTDWTRGWKESGLYDDIALVPYNASEKLCPAGTQYASTPKDIPFAYYHGSTTGAPPPTSGVMRPTTSRSLLPNGNAFIAWGARVGLTADLVSGGPILLATAEIHLADPGIEGADAMLPTLVNIKCPLAPTPSHPDGVDTWKGKLFPGTLGPVGQLYEPWDVSDDNKHLLIAGDVFASGNPGPGIVTARSYTFMDVFEYNIDGSGVRDLTLYNPRIGYGYPLNAAPPPVNAWGYWEEASVYGSWEGHHYVAFCSNAGFPKRTVGLDTWLMDLDTPKVKQITMANDPTEAVAKSQLYPTSWNARDGRLYLADVPTHYQDRDGKGNRPPGWQRAMKLGEALDNGLME